MAPLAKYFASGIDLGAAFPICDNETVAIETGGDLASTWVTKQHRACQGPVTL